MNRTGFAALMLGSLLAGLSHNASAYVCRDDKGSTSYQEDPCPERKGTSGVTPVTASELTEKAAQETVRRLMKAARARDSLATISLLSRDLKAVMRAPDGKAKNYDLQKYVALIKSAYDGTQGTETYKCKAAAASAANRAALLCDVTGEGQSGSKRVRSQSRETIEFALELGEVKIVAIDSTSLSRTEEGRF